MHERVSSAIGGYFGLELPGGTAWHANAFAVNSGRNALRFLLSANAPRKVYVPYFTCRAMTDAVNAMGITVAHYRINEALEPDFDLSSVAPDEAFLYTNYFGFKDHYVRSLAAAGCRIIIDNAQSFFSAPVAGLEFFYSPRKFFGVPDGGYAYFGLPTTAPSMELDRDYSAARAAHLLVRHDVSAQSGYASYQANEALIDALPLRAMSTLTAQILGAIDYAAVIAQRQQNFAHLHAALCHSNALAVNEDSTRVPLCYPLLCKNSSQDRAAELKARLHAQRIFTATYWPEVAQRVAPASVEHLYSTQLLHLPIDQRYGAAEMDRILEVVLA